jgi:hypothetical protein
MQILRGAQDDSAHSPNRIGEGLKRLSEEFYELDRQVSFRFAEIAS